MVFKINFKLNKREPVAMKLKLTNSAIKRIGQAAIVLGAAGIMVNANAWIDERSPEEAELVAQMGERGQDLVNEAAPTPTMSEQWDSIYPGPYGPMKLSEALIAITVPMTKAPITFDAKDADLSIIVNIKNDPNQTRKQVLTDLALKTERRLKYADGVFSIIDDNPKASQSTQIAAKKADEPQKVSTTKVAIAQDQQDITKTSFESLAKDAVPMPAPEIAKKHWKISKGSMLSSAVLDWAKQWNWDLVWTADVDYRIGADIELDDSFLGAVGRVLKAYAKSPRPLQGNWQKQQKVLVICEPGIGQCGSAK